VPKQAWLSNFWNAFYYNLEAVTQQTMWLAPRESICLGFGFNAFKFSSLSLAYNYNYIFFTTMHTMRINPFLTFIAYCFHIHILAVLTIYYIHFEITGDPYNLIGSQECDLFTNRTIFCSKSHLFPSQWEWNTKTKQPIRFEGLFKVTNQITGKPVRFIHESYYFLL